MRKRYLTVKEVADFLWLSPRTVYELARQGQIPAYKFGHQWRFPYGEVVQLTLERVWDYIRRRDQQLLRTPQSPPRGRTYLERYLRRTWKVMESQRQGTSATCLSTGTGSAPEFKKQ